MVVAIYSTECFKGRCWPRRVKCFVRVRILVYLFVLSCLLSLISVFRTGTVFTANYFEPDFGSPTPRTRVVKFIRNEGRRLDEENEALSLASSVTPAIRLRLSRQKRYVQRPWKSDPLCRQYKVTKALLRTLPEVALASFPGSGNTWVRYLIEGSTGVYTGSIYNDYNLYFLGFWGELSNTSAGVTIVKKTHDASAEHIRSFNNGTAILIMRNPYDAILSFHNFLYGGHTGHAPATDYHRAGWPAFFLHEMRAWLAFHSNWTTYAERLMVVHYESLIRDPIPEVRRMVNFLRLPVDELRLSCLQKHPRGKFKRQSSSSSFSKISTITKNQEHVFPSGLRRIIDRGIRYMDFVLRRIHQPPLPLDMYRYYDVPKPSTTLEKRVNLSPTKVINDQEKDELSWSEQMVRIYNDWVPQFFNRMNDDPIENWKKAPGEREKYAWAIPFSPDFPEASLLNRHFNQGPQTQVLPEKSN